MFMYCPACRDLSLFNNRCDCGYEKKIKEEDMIEKYIKKPVEVDVVQWTGANFEEVEKFCKVGTYQNSTSKAELRKVSDDVDDALYITTLEGDMYARYGDYIVKGVAGEVYPCKPDLFARTYEKLIKENTYTFKKLIED